MIVVYANDLSRKKGPKKKTGPKLGAKLKCTSQKPKTPDPNKITPIFLKRPNPPNPQSPCNP